MTKQIILFYLSFIFTSSLVCHDLWLDAKDSNLILRYGHLFSRETQELTYQSNQIQKVQCFDKKVKYKWNYPLRLSKSCPIHWIEFTTGFWTKTHTGLKNDHPKKFTDPIDAWESWELLKYLQQWTSSYQKPFTDNLEIVPLENPLLLKEGDKIQLQVFYNYKPLSNVSVSYRDDVRGNTDSNGKIRIRLQEKGLQLIKVSYTIKGEIRKIYTSILSFKI